MLMASGLFAQSANNENQPLNITTKSNIVSTAFRVNFANGPSVEIITVDGDKPAELLRIKNGKLETLLTVHMDGSVTTANGFQADESAKIFWKALADNYRPVCNQALKDQRN